MQFSICRKALILVLLFLSFTGARRFLPAQGQLIGTYRVNYRYNCAGQPDSYSSAYNPFTNANGAIHIKAVPGKYAIKVVGIGPIGGGGAWLWSGDRNSGTRFSYDATTQREFDHPFGEIVLYYHDWYIYDNNPNSWIDVELYRVDGSQITDTGVELPGFVTPYRAHIGILPDEGQ